MDRYIGRKGGVALITSPPGSAVAQNKCTSLVSSCYAPIRRQTAATATTTTSNSSNNSGHELPSKHPMSTQEAMDPPTKSNDSYGSSKPAQGSSSGSIISEQPLKSNLKKTTILEQPQVRDEKRKVSWPDAHGKDLAHVQEFQSSSLEDGEIEGVRNSCVCVIQ